MTNHCESLHAYVDGELSPDERAAFEVHLATCNDCGAELPRLLALLSALDAAAAVAPAVQPAVPRLSVVADGGSDASPVPGTVPIKLRPTRRRRPLWIASGLTAAAAAAAAIILVGRPGPTPPPHLAVASLTPELGSSRMIEARLSYPGADAFRPRDVARGAQSHESISLTTMAALEGAKDWHGVAVAALLSGEQDRAARFFAQAPASPAVDSDRAALELQDGSPEALERALDDVDRALTTAPDDPHALWNRALVLAKLDLPLAAARDFDRVAARNERGWADEARARAKVLRDTVRQRQDRWEKANAAGMALITDGTPVPADVMSTAGSTTLLLYYLHDAVRVAPSRERALALLPLAQTIDGVYGTDRLAAYVHRVAATDFRIRKPLAESYHDLVVKGALPDATMDAFLKRLEQTATDDIWMGAIVRAGRVAAHLDDYRRRAEATHDPWFAMIAENEAAKAEIAAGKTTAAERRLREAIAVARRERLAYRALGLQDTLASLHYDTRHLAQVASDRQRQYREAIAAGDWRFEMNTLSYLAAVNLDRYEERLARAYLNESLERVDSSPANTSQSADSQYDCARREYVYQSRASASFTLGDIERAREELASAPVCDQPPALEETQRIKSVLRGALVGAQLYRAAHNDEDARLVWASIESLQTASKLLVADRAEIAYLKGELLESTDLEAAKRSLREGIALLARDGDTEAAKWRAVSYNALASISGKESEFSNVISLLAEALEVPKPSQCALAIAIQDEQSTVAYVDSHGGYGGIFALHKSTTGLDVSTLVPDKISGRLRECDRVTVLARAPVLGAGRLLPSEIAWSYALPGATSRVSQLRAANHRVVIDNPEIPADLKLPALSPYPEDENDIDTLWLRGSEATPTRVLQAIRTASVIEFHTHGIIANDVSETSYLVLSPELDRQYALVPSDIEQLNLEAAPLVILGACHAAASSRSLEGGRGLAEAFLRSGARAVIASPDSVPDVGAQTFFRAVRDAVLRGVDPATAVRDERIRGLASSRDDTWVAGVVVFK